MRLDLHPDVYRAAHEAGIVELDDRLVTYLNAMSPTIACRYIADEQVRKIMEDAAGESDKRLSHTGRTYGVDPVVVRAAEDKGYAMNSNFAAFLRGFDSVAAALAHIETMRPRRKRVAA